MSKKTVTFQYKNRYSSTVKYTLLHNIVNRDTDRIALIYCFCKDYFLDNRFYFTLVIYKVSFLFNFKYESCLLLLSLQEEIIRFVKIYDGFI